MGRRLTTGAVALLVVAGAPAAVSLSGQKLNRAWTNAY
jgi:hypothetical protein